jgi:acetyl esterase
MYLLHSADDFAPVAHSRDLAAAQRAAGMPAGRVRVEEVPGSAHGGGLLRLPGVTSGLLRWIAAAGGYHGPAAAGGYHGNSTVPGGYHGAP